MSQLRFGTAGIRGLFNTTFTVADAVAIAHAVPPVFGPGRYVVASDGRRGSHVLAHTIASTLLRDGYDVLELGLVPTPVAAYTGVRHQAQGVFMLTASHNPPEWVGLKLFTADGLESPVALEQQIEARLGQPPPAPAAMPGTSYALGSASADYVDALAAQFLPAPKALTILVDAANGAGSEVTPHVLRRLGHRVITINSHPSPAFPGHLPEPRPDTLVATSELARVLQPDIVFAHDGDADRLALLTPDGQVLPDYVLSTLALQHIARERRGLVILSINTSVAVEQTAEALGCPVTRTRLGKTFETLHAHHAIFATEPSKIIDPRWGKWEDGIYAAALITHMLAQSEGGLTGLLRTVPHYTYLQRNLPIRVDRTRFYAQLQAAWHTPAPTAIDTQDGVRLLFADRSWLLFRASGTEPLVRVYAEAATDEAAQALLEEGARLVHRLAPT